MALAVQNQQLQTAPPDLQVGSVTLDGCRDTTVGTRVTLKGDLVFNQYLKVGDKTQPTDIKALKDLLVVDTTKKYLLNWKLLLLSVIVAGLVAGSIVTTLKLLKAKAEGNEHIDDDSSEDLPMNFTARLETRGEWFAKEHNVSSDPLLFRPAKFVVVAHTGGPGCDRSFACANIVKGIQMYHIGLGYGDISYNFLVGGDGKVYEGRGWGKYGTHTYGVNCDSIGVAFIGDFDATRLKQSSVDAFDLLVQEGVSVGEIAPDYKLFAHSQVINTASPGLHIKEVIRNWSHWAPVTKQDFICPG